MSFRSQRAARFRRDLFLCILAASVLGCAWAAIPPPADMAVDVVVSGRTSTIRSLTVRSAGQEIPATYSGDRIHNTPGFSWYVSRHYALKTDYGEMDAHRDLALLEAAYPQYLAFFGLEPPGIEAKRMAVVDATSKESLARALQSDGIAWDFSGGGITFDGYNTSYVYPSGSLQYHHRYILLHEAVHLYQDCLFGSVEATPLWFYEGIADVLANHTWDEEHQRLTVSVVDKPTVHNWYDEALQRYRKEPFTASQILSGAKSGRELGFLLVTYFTTDVDRAMRFRIWWQEMCRWRLRGAFRERSDRLLRELFGPRETLDAGFAAWVKERRDSFHYVDWGWEQDGDTLMSYGYPQTGAYSQTNLLLALSDKPDDDPLVMDYPEGSAPAVVGPVARGVQEPSVGCVIGFRLNPHAGEAGLGFGVEGRSFYKVLISAAKELILDGRSLKLPRQVFPLPAPLRTAIAGAGCQLGLTVRITEDSLVATVRAGEPGKVQEFSAGAPLNAAARERLLSRPLCVLSRGGRHFITPFVDASSRPEPDPNVPAPANRWRNPAQEELYGLYRAAWRLGGGAPGSLLALRGALCAAATQDIRAQAEALARFRRERPMVARDIRSSAAPPATQDRAIADLYGLDLDLRVQPPDKGDLAAMEAVLTGPSGTAGRLRLSLGPECGTAAPGWYRLPVVLPGGSLWLTRLGRITDPSSPARATATLEATVDGQHLTLTAGRLLTPTPSGWRITPE